LLLTGSISLESYEVLGKLPVDNREFSQKGTQVNALYGCYEQYKPGKITKTKATGNGVSVK